MEDRNTPQFTIGELLNALEGCRKEEKINRDAIMGHASRITHALSECDMKSTEEALDWITYDAMHVDRLRARRRQAETAIRTLNKFVKIFN